MPSSPKETTSTQISQVQLPDWVNSAAQDNISMANTISATPYQKYTGPLNAGLDYGRTQNNINDAYNQAYSGYDSSNAALTSVAGYTPQQVGLGGYTPATVGTSQVGTSQVGTSQVQASLVANPNAVKDVTAQTGLGNISQYYNPYEDQVVQSAQTAGQQSIDASQRANSDAAISAGAFGSSRHGVTEGVTAAQGAQDIAQTVGGIRSAGYTQALGALQNDENRTLQADQGNQQSALTTEAQRLSANTTNANNLLSASMSNASNTLAASTANASNTLAASTANAANGLSASTTNAQLLEDRAKMQLAADQGNQSADLSGAQLRLGAGQALGNNATAQSSALLSTADARNKLALEKQQTAQAGMNANYGQFQDQVNYPTQQLNLRLAALGMTPYGKTTTSSGTSTESGGENYGMMALGGLSSLFSFSDPKLKKNVKTVGHGVKGIPVKQFEYRQDTAAGPLPKGKQIGYMADDVKEKMPSAVKRVPIGKGQTAMAVDYAKTGRPGLFGFSKTRAA